MAKLTAEYMRMVEGLESGRLRVPSVPRRNPRTSSFAGPPSYNRDIKSSGPIFQGSVKGYEEASYAQAPKASNPAPKYFYIAGRDDARQGREVSSLREFEARYASELMDPRYELNPAYRAYLSGIVYGQGGDDASSFLSRQSNPSNQNFVPARTVNPVTPFRGGMRRNPESGAAAMYETFHQRAPERVEEYEENFHYHGWLAELGEMQEIKVALIYLDPPKEAVIRFDPGTKLGCSEDGRQLYLVGGDQSVDLKSLGFGKEWVRDYMLLGVLHELTYRTKKGFDKFKTIDYYHELGEDSGDLPVLAYDNLNQQLMVVGGKYVVKYEGIVN